MPIRFKPINTPSVRLFINGLTGQVINLKMIEKIKSVNAATAKPTEKSEDPTLSLRKIITENKMIKNIAVSSKFINTPPVISLT